MSDPRFPGEKRLTILARHGQSVRRRWAFAVLGLAIALADAGLALFPAEWYVIIAVPVALIAANAWCAARIAAGRATPVHFWMMLCADALVLAAMCALASVHGPIIIAFNVVVAAAYGLGLPRAARVHIALTIALYPIARVASGAGSPVGIMLETVCLATLSWLAIESPMRFTYRLRRARRALRALERGDFSQRLPTRALDDLGFLAVSFNSTAEALGAVVDELRRSREALAHQAFHDPLTGLANRTRFHDRLRSALAGEHPERAAVVMVDLDGFKTVNDRLGHAAGDRLLRLAAERLLNATRGCDTVARFGGDEFAVLLENVTDAADAAVVVERILGTLGAPYEIEGEIVRVGASVGVARHVVGKARDADAAGDALLRDADAAMYAAKARGKGRYEVHADGAGRRAKARA